MGKKFFYLFIFLYFVEYQLYSQLTDASKWKFTGQLIGLKSEISHWESKIR